MSDIEEDIEEPASVPSAADASAPTLRSKGQRRSLGNLARELTEDELASPGAQKLMIEELERLDSQVRELSQFREDYYCANTTVEVYRERLKRHNAFDTISSGTLAIGAVIVGYTPSLWGSEVNFWMAIALGTILMGIGLWAKRVKS